MPKAEDPRDVVFQIGVCIKNKNTEKKLLLSLGKVDPLSDVEILMYKNEQALLMGFNSLVKKIKPQIITGYNIFRLIYLTC